MTLLPQLEQELIAAHQRRDRSARRRGGVGLALAVGVAIAVAAVAVIVTGHRHVTTGAQQPAGITGPTTAWTPARILVRGLHQPSGYAAGNNLFVVDQLTAQRSQLEWLDGATGQTRAGLAPAWKIDHVLFAAGRAWITMTNGARTAIARVNGRDLSHPLVILPGSGPNDGDVGSMAAAGGALWVGTAQALVRLSLTSTGAARVTGSVPIPGALGVQVAASSDGRILMDSEGHGTAHVERRDPRSGALLRRSAAFTVVTKPRIGGIVDDGAWISWSGGMAGNVQKLDLHTFRPTTVVHGTNGIDARVLGGILWVTQPGGGESENYCGDPVNGRARLSLPIVAVEPAASLLAASGRYVYFVAGKGGPKGQLLLREAIPRQCR